jgi:hypothetical protein
MTRSGQRWWSSNKLGEASQVLGDGSEHKLVLCATWAAETETAEPKDAFQVRESHLDAFAVVP